MDPVTKRTRNTAIVLRHRYPMYSVSKLARKAAMERIVVTSRLKGEAIYVQFPSTIT